MSYFLQKDLLRLSIYFCKFFFFCHILDYELISLLHRTDCNSLFGKNRGWNERNFTYAKGRQFMVLKKILQTPDYYLWQPKNLSAVKGTPTLTSMLRTKPVKEYVFGTRNRFFFRFSTYWFVWVALLFSYPPLMALREKTKASEMPVKTAKFHHPYSWDMVKEKEEELKILESSRYRL